MKITKSKRRKIWLIPKQFSEPGQIFVIGWNEFGQLGLGEDVYESKSPKLLNSFSSIIDIAAGGIHSVCLNENGQVFTFGCNDEGALGRETLEPHSEQVPGRVDIPERIVQVSAGDSHSAALSVTGQVYIWGNFRDRNGSMGLVNESCIEFTPVKILNNVIVVEIASGSDHLVCLSQDCSIYTSGCAEKGQLGRIGEYAGIKDMLTPDIVRVAESYRFGSVSIWTGSSATFCKVQDSGLIYAFGLNNYNQLGLASSIETTILRPQKVTSFKKKLWTKITGNQHHTLALDENMMIYSLGCPEYGRLGLGNAKDIKSTPTIISTLQSKKCIDISCGNCTSFAVTEDGYVYSWGMGDIYQLGHGDEEDKYVPTRIEGNFGYFWKAHRISAAGHHVLIIAKPREYFAINMNNSFNY